MCFSLLVSNVLQNWMAFTNLRVDNFTITDSLVFTNTNSPSPQDNYALCQVRINSNSFVYNVTDTLSGDCKRSKKQQFALMCMPKKKLTVCQMIFYLKWSVGTIDHFRVLLCLCFKTSLSAKPEKIPLVKK